MNILITGMAGFIGSHIAEELLKNNNVKKIIGIDNLYSGKQKNIDFLNSIESKCQISFYQIDIRDFESLVKIMKNYSIDYVFHEAAVASVQKSIEEPQYTNDVNIKGTLNVLEAARRTNVKKVIFASSAAVYGKEISLPKDENSIISPISPYGYEKLMGENYLKLYAELYGLNSIALRYFNVFGERQDPTSEYSGVISIFDNKVKNNEDITIFGNGEQYRDFIYVKDIVQANINAMLDKRTGFHYYCVGTGNKTSLLQLVDALKEKYNKNINVNFKEERYGDIKESLCCNNKIKSELKLNIEKNFKENLKLF